MFEESIDFIKSKYPQKKVIPLHEPFLGGNEKKYLNECIDSGFVSSVGAFVGKFEEEIASYLDAKHAVATVNGTSALHLALLLVGVASDDEVLTQAFTFVGTVAPIRYLNANPVFIDISPATLGMSAEKLGDWLKQNTIIKKDGHAYNKTSGKRISACVPMHTFGHPCEIDAIVRICRQYNIPVVEDSAESIGSNYKDRSTGTFGSIGILSFNGNKTITAGGGGMLVTDDPDLASRAKHLSTTAKIPHSWDFIHDEVGYNYRLTNLSAALALAQLEQLDTFLRKKRQLSEDYRKFFNDFEQDFIIEPKDASSNYWLNAIVLKDKSERDRYLEMTNREGIMTRPAWRLIHLLAPYKDFQTGDLTNSEYFADRIVNIPSSVI